MNIFEIETTVDKPEGIPDQSLQLYVPVVTEDKPGIAKYDVYNSEDITHKNGDFIVSNGKITLYKLDTIDNSNHLAKSSAIKTYVDSQNEIILQAAKDYADAQDILTLQAAKNYANSQNELILQSAKDYADNSDNNVKTWVSTNYLSQTNAASTYVTKIDEQNDISTLNTKIDAIQGKGGYLLPYNFGTSTPTEEQLNAYALSQISSIDSPSEIYNGTKVTNRYDNHTWILNNALEEFEWVDIGFEYATIATDYNLGIVKGSTADYYGSINPNGEITINKLGDLVTTVGNLSGTVSSQGSAITTIQNNYLTTNTAQDITAIKTVVSGSNKNTISSTSIKFEDNLSTAQFYNKAELNKSGLTLYSVTNDVTQGNTIYQLDKVVYKNSYNLAFPNKSGTFAMTSDIPDVSNFVTMTQIENILAGYERARAFDTLSDMATWLSDVDNKGVLKVGDELLIVASNTPDYWVTEVLQTADSVTGYYYKITELETKQIDLTNYATKTYVDTSIQTAIQSTWEANY